MTHLFLYKEEWLEISLIPSLRWVSRHYTTPSKRISNGRKWIESNYDDLLRARFLNKTRDEKRGSRREWKESQNPKDMINSLRIPLTFKSALLSG